MLVNPAHRMTNPSTYITRYGPILAQACDALPEPTTFPAGTWTPNTHVVRLREVRRYLTVHPASLPESLRTPDHIDKLNSLNFWAVDDTIFIGHRERYSMDSDLLHTAPTTTTAAWNVITKTLTPADLQALFYCYNNELLSSPTRVENPSPDIITLAKRFSSQCPNVGFSLHETSFSLL